MALSDIVPINRKEEFLQAIADKSGAPSPVTRIEEFLKRISESSSLPEVTSEDNGDFLGVVDGEWDKVPAPSSLPPYTAADLGKVLTVGDAEPVETVVVPEQTVTVTGAGPSTWVTVELTGVDFSKLSDGDTVSVSMGGQATDMEYEENGASGAGLYINGRLFIDSTYLHANKNGEVTVSATASVPSVEPKWEAAAYHLPIEYDDTAEIFYIQKSHIGYILNNSPLCVVIDVNGGKTTYATINGVDASSGFIRYSSIEYQSDNSIGYPIPALFADFDSEAVIYVSQYIDTDSSTTPPTIVPQIDAYTYNPATERYEYT